jgi:hypothetical protein
MNTQPMAPITCHLGGTPDVAAISAAAFAAQASRGYGRQAKFEE